METDCHALKNIQHESKLDAKHSFEVDQIFIRRERRGCGTELVWLTLLPLEVPENVEGFAFFFYFLFDVTSQFFF